MEVRRVFVDKLKIKNGMALLAGPVHRYICTVLRKTSGDRIDLIDGKGYLYRCNINAIKSKELYLQVLDVVHRPEEQRPKVTLCVSPIKGPRMDWLVEKATELCVDRILPTVFRRTMIKLDGKEKEKCERWKKLTIEASRQSGRFAVPEVVEPTPLRGILPHIEHVENRWAFYEKERETTIRDVISSRQDNGICVVIGPEGGIEDTEMTWLKENGFIPCTLGESIFRTETTPLVILSIVLYECSRK
ncbi:RsmE family RNA methyltransferase [Syntrophorhabdus aromaticivorans]|uniref:Ribosomal RNA small subunit methyltransferase E n=1 Tax=Syntrophorhabdus aromaticivorans TaxID=328301 RepID=A0A351U6Z9_9BACT|nr:RsmE family RNA methyltransferase [Syntrophorhabdus aromaticivorans]NLW35408.1 16S rRNA (uracil(1498)-N(3))-methyltransferase [Syntrophorhabdus aromaticivorans]HBA55730.1 16S rRNA (uracil(1498)-N(3))-methyltransferase [Syntrophorhabdus aromaticivorans]